jgi:membrane protease YdiL (CAAX protease family)
VSAATTAARAQSIVTFSLVQVAIATALVALGAVRVAYDVERDLIGILPGVVAGVLLFYVLAYDGAAKPVPAKSSAVLRLAALLAAVSIAEEIIWRGYALATLRTSTGPLVALIATTLGFAAAHATTQGWSGIRNHLVTGFVIGLVFVLTRSLLAAVMTHLSYNLMFLRTLAPQGRLFP